MKPGITDTDYALKRHVCFRKIRYPTKQQAREIMRREAARGVPGLKPYTCPFGNHWHLGHLGVFTKERLKVWFRKRVESRYYGR